MSRPTHRAILKLLKYETRNQEAEVEEDRASSAIVLEAQSYIHRSIIVLTNIVARTEEISVLTVAPGFIRTAKTKIRLERGCSLRGTSLETTTRVLSASN